jgi:hypothetical protein
MSERDGVADIETSVAVTAQTDDLQSGLAQAADAVASASASMVAQFSDLGSAARQAQDQITAATAQIGSALQSLQGKAAGLAGSVGGGIGGPPHYRGTGEQFPGFSVTEANGDESELKGSLDQQWELEQDYYEKKQRAAVEDAETQQKLIEQQQIAYAQYLAQREKLDTEAAQTSEGQWQNVLQPVQRSLDRSITSLITGTTTVQKALSNLAQSAVGGIVKATVGSGFSGLGALLGGAGQFGGSGGDQDFSGGVADAGTGILEGGIFCQLFRSIGSLFSFERGGIVASAQAGWAVPQLGPGGVLAQLHSNEMVLPANISQGLQSMIAGGGGGAANITFAVSAMDSQSVASFFRNNGATLVTAINRAIRNGSSLNRAAA